MIYDLDRKLSGIISDSQIELIEECLNTLALYRYDITASELQLFMEGCGQLESMLIQDTVMDIVRNGLQEVLNLLEIGVMDCQLWQMMDIVRGLYYMENTDQSSFIVDTIDNAESNKEALLELLAHFTGKSADYYFPFLDDFTSSYLNKLHEIHLPIANLAVEDISSVDVTVIDRCRKFLNKYSHTFISDAVNNEQIKPGISANLLFAKYNLQLSSLYPNALDQLAIEIVGLMCLTNTPNKTFGMDVKNMAKNIVPDQMVAAQMVTILDDITMRLGIYA